MENAKVGPKGGKHWQRRLSIIPLGELLKKVSPRSKAPGKPIRHRAGEELDADLLNRPKRPINYSDASNLRKKVQFVLKAVQGRFFGRGSQGLLRFTFSDDKPGDSKGMEALTGLNKKSVSNGPSSWRRCINPGMRLRTSKHTSNGTKRGIGARACQSKRLGRHRCNR